MSLPEALELVLLAVDDTRRFRRAALCWHARYCGEAPDVGFEEAYVEATPPTSLRHGARGARCFLLRAPT